MSILIGAVPFRSSVSRYGTSLGGKRTPGQEWAYPDVLASLSAAESRALGEQYIEQTRIQRKCHYIPAFIKNSKGFFYVLDTILVFWIL